MPSPKHTPKRMVSGKDAAAYLGLPNDNELRQTRCDKVGRFATLPYYKIGSRCMYCLNDLDAWIDKHKVERAA